MELITDESIESNCSIIKNIPPKEVSLPDFMLIFVMLVEDFLCFFCSTNLSESSDMAKYWAIFYCSVF